MPELTKGSHTLIEVECQFQVSEECRRTYTSPYKSVLKCRKDNAGKDICLFCSRKLKSSGKNNPNRKYTYNENWLSLIDTQEKAYFLGWVASDGSITKSGVSLSIRDYDIHTLTELIRFISPDIPIFTKEGKMIKFTINSKEIVSDICKWLQISPGKKDALVRAPELAPELASHFARGYFEGDGSISHPGSSKNYPTCSLASNSPHMRSYFHSLGFPCSMTDQGVYWSHNNALDLLGYLYRDAKYVLERKFERYAMWSQWVPSLSGAGSHGKFLEFSWNKADKRAIPPSKARSSDSGFDLSLVSLDKQVGNVLLYDTGVKIRPEYGWYFLVAPRSSLIKTGYILANSVGVIDRTYTGTIKVALIKIDPSARELELPCRVVQLIPMPIIHAKITEVTEEEFNQCQTARGEGGFGSTGQ